ncbi:MAG: FAD-dependent oxidoreductase [Hamadaea sp.]|nr:FAD-dependent oxidoreductase [Hamadaea sp.]
MRSTVAVIGGGYGGIEVARALDETADVVLVEPREAFHHNAAALRAAVRPDWVDRTFLPYDKLLVHGRVERDHAVTVTPGEVTLGSGRVLAADYIVLATGARHPFPGKPEDLGTPAAQDEYRRLGAELAVAGRILLAGAGPIGLELAGEIRAAWPDKEVVIVDPQPQILPDRSAELREEITRQLGDLGVEMILGASVTGAVPPAGQIQPFTVTLSDGREIGADLWLRCYGASPATAYLTGTLAQARRDDGRVRVTPTLLVDGHDTVFAIGDITDVEEPKQAISAIAHAAIVAANIKALSAGEELVSYEPAGSSILIPLGPGAGAGEHPGMGLIDAAVTASYKGEDLLVGHYREVFRL